MTASETKTIVASLEFIIGELINDKKDRYWELYKLLKQMLSLALSKIVMTQIYLKLKDVIKKHYTLYIKLVGRLTPKHYIILHYPRLMSLYGPMVNLWSMRYEGKHRPFK